MPPHRTETRRAAPGASLIAGLLLAVAGCSAEGDTDRRLSIQCAAGEAGGPPALSLGYEGGGSGTLTIASALGDMALPASWQQRQGTNEGQTYTVTGVQASGKADLRMPDRRAMEACMAKRAEGIAGLDGDVVTMFGDACRRETPAASQPVPVTAKVEIAITENEPDVYVVYTLTYDEASAVPGGHIALDSMPPPACRLAKAP